MGRGLASSYPKDEPVITHMNRYLRTSVTPGDLEYLSVHLRDADKREIHASSGLDPLTGLQFSCSVSEHLHIIELTPGVPAGIFGVARTGVSSRPIWMVATDELQERPMTVL